MGIFLVGKLRGRSLVKCWCRLLRNSSLVLHNSSLACACPSIAARDASIFAIKRLFRSSCSSQASACSLSHSALASSWICSWICSCSHLCSSLASWRALMTSMSCCKTGESLPSDPCKPYLLFLITLEGSITNADQIKFYRVDLGLTGWASFASSLSLLGALEQRSVETKRALPVDHTPTIKLVRTYKIIISFSL